MVDLRPALSALLSPLARVELSFPGVKAAFPVITLTEISTTTVAVYDGKERLSDVDWQVDIWDNRKTAKQCVELAGKASDILIKHGLTRYFGQLLPDASVPYRYTMRFRGRLDNKTMIMYRS